ncbi:MAG: ECF transporter S component [Sporomusaceae bacterium]|nr:ECF transporter S component [Sporomusaceae bacterium]
MKRDAVVQSRSGIRQLTTVGMLSAICVVMGMTGYGFIPLPMMKATIMHVPVIIGTILEGPVVGMSIGLLFGLFSIFQAITTPTILSFAFLNPLVSVLPRILIALTAYYTYKLLPAGGSSLRISVAAVVGSLTNTIGVLGMIYVLYAAEFATVRGISEETVLGVIGGIAAMNGIPEAVICALITVPVVLAIRKVRR